MMEGGRDRGQTRAGGTGGKRSRPALQQCSAFILGVIVCLTLVSVYANMTQRRSPDPYPMARPFARQAAVAGGLDEGAIRRVVADAVRDEVTALREELGSLRSGLEMGKVANFSGLALPGRVARGRGGKTARGAGGAVYALPHLWCPHGQHGGHGVDLTEKTLKFIPPGQLVIDVGAFDGSNAISMAGAGHRVLSFEPTPSKVANIKSKIAAAERRGLKGSIQFFPYAASNFSGEAPFVVNAPVVVKHGRWTVDERADTSVPDNLGSEQDAFAVPWNLDKSATVPVKVEKMDNMVPSGETVLFMKVDAQGHDFRVLQGADRLLSEQRVLVLLAEFNPTLMKGGWREGVEMLEFLQSKGYVCSACGTTWPLGMEQGLPIDFEQWTKHIYNQKFEHRGANHGQWDDIVCVADGARRSLTT